MTESELHVARKAIKRKRIFLTMSIAGILMGPSLAVIYSWQAATSTGFQAGIHFVLVVLIPYSQTQSVAVSLHKDS